MNDNEFLENPEDIETPQNPTDPASIQDDIFVKGLAGTEFKGKPLAPLCFMRRRAAFAMGLRFGTLSQDEFDALETSGFYKGIDTDVCIVLWLCSVPKSEVLKSIRLPEQAMVKALNWSEKNEVEPGTPEFSGAADYMLSEFVALAKTRGEFKQADGSKPKTSGPSLGN